MHMPMHMNRFMKSTLDEVRGRGSLPMGTLKEGMHDPSQDMEAVKILFQDVVVGKMACAESKGRVVAFNGLEEIMGREACDETRRKGVHPIEPHHVIVVVKDVEAIMLEFKMDGCEEDV